MSELGDLVQEYRRDRDLTMRELAQKAGIHYSYVSRIEAGFVPKRGVVRRLAQALVAPMDVMLAAAGYLPEEFEPETWAASRSDGYGDELPPEARRELREYVRYLKEKYGG